MARNKDIFKINSIVALNIIILILSSIIIFIFANYYKHTLYSIAVTATFTYTMFYITWFTHYKVKLNFYTIFLTFTYLFYFGQFFLLLIGVPLESGRTIVDGLLPTDKIIETGILIINFMVVLHLSVILSTLNINKYKINNYSLLKSVPIGVGNFKKLAIFLFIISIIPSFIILIENIKITMTLGYGAIFQSQHYTLGGFNNILKFLSIFTIPSFLMLLISYRNDKKIKLINFILFIYLSLYFLSGSRLNGVLLLSTILLISHYWYKPVNYKATIKLVTIAFIGLSLLSLISEMRNAVYLTTNPSDLLVGTLQNVLIRNPIFLAMEEAGYTFLATATVLTYSPDVVPHYFGMSYINSIFMLIPNLFWDVHPAARINTDIVFQGFLTKYGGIGSSFIAESYWNFGYLSLFSALVFGGLIGTLTKKIVKYAEYSNAKMFYLTIYIAQISLIYVRSDTVSFWRNFVYYGIIPILILYLLSLKRIKR